MRHPAKRLYTAALALCLFAGGYARADQIDWSYNWTPSATKISADAPNAANSYITLSNQASGISTGDSFIVASNINTVSDVPPATPSTFTNAGYTLTLAITDAKAAAAGDPNSTGSVTFTGQLNGILSSKSAIIMNDFTNGTTQSVQIGDHLYTVKIGPFAPPGPPTAQNSGSISALASVTVAEAPEPSTLMMSAMCLTLCGAGWWWKRGRRAALNLA